jgi:tetratricopeptide (TPR) repeat protein
MESAEEREVAGDLEGTLAAYEAAQRLLPGNDEAAFWVAALLTDRGRIDDARAILRDMVVREPGWADLMRRLPRAGLLRAGDEAIERVLNG